MAIRHRTRGTSRAYILDRLRRQGHEDLAQAVERGEVSATACAVELGWTKRAPLIDGSRPQAAQRREGVLHALRRDGAFGEAAAQRTTVMPAEAMELRLGPNPDDLSWRSLFRDVEDLRLAWDIERERLLAHCSPRRPLAWWNFDGKELGLEWPGLDYEKSYLWEHGVLSATERLGLEGEWRKAFDEAQQPGFCEYTDNKMVKGARARLLLYRNEDIPAELLARWRKERSRRPKKDSPQAGTPCGLEVPRGEG
jgi:hypothetical protein